MLLYLVCLKFHGLSDTYYSNLDKLREFIKYVYVEKKYAGGISSDKPPRDMQVYSKDILFPGHQGKQLYEDRFANETPNSRNSDYTVTSGGGSSRFDGQSLNLQDTDYSSPPLHQVRNILIEDTRTSASNTYADANIKKNVNGFPHSQGGTTHEQKSTNPFDLPYDSDVATDNLVFSN
ncbi:hypothetical protein B296_00054945 [Ensete ventricosum]|uniref:Uncharacterized protein n=1 Tax=Ensete ventricosum TaxID=4639 RepID=A0A426Y1Q9_ENSVE|nr:hypothetical protein B296_00054945 [Ensete ventricosum]